MHVFRMAAHLDGGLTGHGAGEAHVGQEFGSILGAAGVQNRLLVPLVKPIGEQKIPQHDLHAAAARVRACMHRRGRGVNRHPPAALRGGTAVITGSRRSCDTA